MDYCVARTRRLAGVLFLLLWITGCSHNLPREALPSDVPAQVELTETPFYPQERYQCGPASLAMVLGQRGVAVTPDELVSRVYLPERQGSVVPEMVATARSYGMLVYELPTSINALLQEVAAGNPVLVLQNLGFSWFPQWHYAVVVGYDMDSQLITLRSGTTERHQISLGLFDRTWRRGKRWGVVLLVPGTLPASNNSLSYMQGAYALELTKQHAAAIAAYAGATQRWPERELSWLAKSNLEYRLGRFAEAVQTLESGLVRLPDAPQLWNNLAYALAGQGCRDKALDAVTCAIQLAPGEDGYRQSRDEIRQMEVPPSTNCPPVNCPVQPAR